MTPTLHKPIPMGTRVVVPAGWCSTGPVTGTVEGIAFMHVIFGYIVVLDEPIQTEFGAQRAVAVTGPQLTGVNGEHWRLDMP